MKFSDRERRVLLIVVAFMGIAGCSRDAEPPVDTAPVVTGDPVLRALDS